MAFKIFGEHQKWREWRGFNRDTMSRICSHVHRQHEAFYQATKIRHGLKYAYHSGVEGIERTYSTMLGEALHKNGYQVVSEFESDDTQTRKKIQSKRICDLWFLKGQNEYVVEVKLLGLAVHLKDKGLIERVRKARTKIREQVHSVERDTDRIGWVFGRVWQKVKKGGSCDSDKIAKKVETEIRKLAESEMKRGDGLFAWYKP